MSLDKIEPTKLKFLNAHPRDEFIHFDEGPHIYTVHGEQGYTSVTTWNHSHFSHFDADEIIEKTMKSKKMQDPNYKYYGMTKNKYLILGKKKEASEAGTNTL